MGGERSGVRVVVLGLALLYFEMTAPRRSECFLDRNKRFSVYVHMRSRCSHCWHLCWPLQRTLRRLHGSHAFGTRDWEVGLVISSSNSRTSRVRGRLMFS